jgi:hypothetical protein
LQLAPQQLLCAAGAYDVENLWSTGQIVRVVEIVKVVEVVEIVKVVESV